MIFCNSLPGLVLQPLHSNLIHPKNNNTFHDILLLLHILISASLHLHFSFNQPSKFLNPVSLFSNLLENKIFLVPSSYCAASFASICSLPKSTPTLYRV